MELQQNTSRITWDGGDALKNREAQSFRRCISAMLWGDQHLTQIEPFLKVSQMYPFSAPTLMKNSCNRLISQYFNTTENPKEPKTPLFILKLLP
jgi:hypothetical protein